MAWRAGALVAPSAATERRALSSGISSTVLLT
jgi:hypothetical protein